MDVVTSPAAAPSLTWQELHNRIVELNSHGHQIATVWHPHAACDFVETKLGNVRAQPGTAAAYQLTTGEIVEL